MRLDEIVSRPFGAALIWATLAAGAIFLFIFDPARSGFFPRCPFRAVTGFACPGCGSTRGLYCLLQGDVVAAFNFNPLLILSLPFLFYALLRYTIAALRGRPIAWKQVNPRYIWVLVAAILSFWLFRNTPFYPWARL